MNNKVTIGELGIMVENLSKTLTDHTKTSNEFYKELREDFVSFSKEVRESLEKKVPVESFNELKEDMKTHKKEVDDKIFSMSMKLSGLGAIAATVMHFLK